MSNEYEFRFSSVLLPTKVETLIELNFVSFRIVYNRLYYIFYGLAPHPYIIRATRHFFIHRSFDIFIIHHRKENFAFFILQLCTILIRLFPFCHLALCRRVKWIGKSLNFNAKMTIFLIVSFLRKKEKLWLKITQFNWQREKEQTLTWNIVCILSRFVSSQKLFGMNFYSCQN